MLIILASCNFDFSFMLNCICISLWYHKNYIGFIKTTDIKSSFGGLQCSVSIIIDDVINGNVTNAGT